MEHRVWIFGWLSVALAFVGAAGRAAAEVPVARGVNPIIAEGTFLSDPAGRVGPDGALWVFGSRDEHPQRYCSAFNDVLRTDDVTRWTRRDAVYSAAGLEGANGILYAPDAIFYRGKWRLFFCTPGRYVEGVAEAERPEGPFANPVAYPFAKQIDPSIFVDDDGKVYYTWGQFAMKMAQLKDDLSGVEGEIRTNVIDERRHGFHEGSQLFKRNGIYYLAYADISRDHGTGMKRPTSIGYATSKSVFGPYVYRGVIVDNFGCDPETWNNHGGVVEYKGRWYVFYHRTTNASRSMRKACVEEIFFDKDGLIREVEMTCGGPAGPLDAFSTTPARLACTMTGHVRIVTSADARERLGEIRAGDTATWRYFTFARPAKSIEIDVLPQAGGRLAVFAGKRKLGEANVPAGNGTDRVCVSVPFTGGLAEKKAAITLSFTGKKDANLGALEAFRFR